MMIMIMVTRSSKVDLVPKHSKVHLMMMMGSVVSSS